MVRLVPVAALNAGPKDGFLTRNASASPETVQDLAMSPQTKSFALPESMRKCIDNRVATGNHGNTSEHIRDLVRRDQEEQAKKPLRDLIEEGLASGPGRRRGKADGKELLRSLAARSIEAGGSAPADARKAPRCSRASDLAGLEFGEVPSRPPEQRITAQRKHRQDGHRGLTRCIDEVQPFACR
jgi:antitoxin ParD1/3/4